MKRALVTVLLTLALPASAEGPAPAPAHSAPFLYEIDGPKAKHFLLGSVHVLPASAHPLPAALDAAYEATSALTIEADLAALAAPELQGRMLGAARDLGKGGLQARIGKPLFARLQKHAAKLGMPTPVCEQFQAWFCALALELFPLQQAGFASEFGIDNHFYARATDDARPVSGLETAQFQVELFTGMSPALSRQLLAATLDEDTYTSQSPEELYRIWRGGDLVALDKVLKELRQRYPELNALLLGNRNRAWMPGLLERFRSQTPQLVVVGAAHLAGSDGLLALLKAQGIEAKPATGVIELAKPPV
ncbi:MAG TPA: TraB/GumN family protein [Verrucomicrobiae bacterium]|nr:TraB/GumN family protein [Verrucomicrobiae bacterium]